MTGAHVHTWTLVNAALGRYRCACGVYGHKPTIVSLRNPKDRDVKPYLSLAEQNEVFLPVADEDRVSKYLARCETARLEGE